MELGFGEIRNKRTHFIEAHICIDRDAMPNIIMNHTIWRLMNARTNKEANRKERRREEEEEGKKRVSDLINANHITICRGLARTMRPEQ